uniref:SFRICE_021844 n=1 Tax=Spodoptera frugiperda TaxID=7108 RepID=A0A2H1VW53_SPOFR
MSRSAESVHEFVPFGRCTMTLVYHPNDLVNTMSSTTQPSATFIDSTELLTQRCHIIVINSTESGMVPSIWQ